MKIVSLIVAFNILVISMGFTVPVLSCSAIDAVAQEEIDRSSEPSKKVVCCASKDNCSSNENDDGCCDDNSQYFQQDFAATLQLKEDLLAKPAIIAIFSANLLYPPMLFKKQKAPTLQCLFGVFHGPPSVLLQVFRC